MLKIGDSVFVEIFWDVDGSIDQTRGTVTDIGEDTLEISYNMPLETKTIRVPFEGVYFKKNRWRMKQRIIEPE